ncbi:bifunctional DNA-formamidopyrimidine glycosylase/DNA-(apurinic or apyrimidinic site) lyase [Marinicella gelatinilytica]|uniref:bifunctional DNA-formamidopyrimidine glycosylase/DNA-(apurinic or apyrimidinic site) lyase n=1 Tax=Marinicella gelatinilytica TaxID=2996017 RepID=UPI002260B0CB|nr:bifunctional DNA-formamidopyrimidine glycosylase/DNA-(apurinic or apyrimidinic site) lyase [Marinicella gelatinilytica]MCX7545283.1 bifunctional DNA-formamidopyrimidine glycosylase/DNA-(apurinic or apyrimidinic site) lyase [Marinicella gelatinilytica]
MPELPEVETTRRGLNRYILNKTINHVIVRQAQLRWPIPADIRDIEGQQIVELRRRGKYILAKLSGGRHLLMHLGMSGAMSVVPVSQPVKKHDHFELQFHDGQTLRFHDPRRFGCILLTNEHPEQHSLLASLGPEPLSNDFNGQWLKDTAKNRTVAVKNFIMNSQVVVGVGNIYAAEALFQAGIHPKRAASRISLQRYESLANAIKAVLQKAIKAGGTTLQDFTNSEGKPGYFQQELQVYGHQGQPCRQCNQTIRNILIGSRSSYYCQQCQR